MRKMPDITISDDLKVLEEGVRRAIAEHQDIKIVYPQLLSVSVTTRYQPIIPIIERLEVFKSEIRVELNGFPLCVFPRENNRWMGFINMITPFAGIFIDKCSDCNFRQFCHGIPKGYIEKFGDEEISSPTEEELFFCDVKTIEGIRKHWETSVNECRYHWDNFFKDVPGKILDVGTGFGAFVSFDPKRIIGIDIDEQALDNAMKDLLGLDLRHNDATAIDFPDNTFDGVHSRFALEHMSFDKARKAFSEMVRVLKPGGKIFVLVAGPFATNAIFESDETHFSKEDLEKIASDNNLTRHRVVRGDFYQPFFHFDFDAKEPLSAYPELAVLLIGEK